MNKLILTIFLAFIFSVSAIGQDSFKAPNDSTKLTSQQMFDKGNEYYKRKEYDQSIVWIRKSADMGNLEAICRLGYMYSVGYGVPLDPNEAVRLTEVAANEGYPKAEYNMAYFYGTGEGVDPSFRKAVRWYKKSARHGYPDAQSDLGSMYYEGKGVNQNYFKAKELFEKAAEKGIHEAQCNLGHLYYEGLGVGQDRSTAFFWYMKAADQGHPDAQFQVGKMLENGIGVDKDKSRQLCGIEKRQSRITEMLLSVSKPLNSYQAASTPHNKMYVPLWRSV